MDTNDPGHQMLSDDETVRSLFEENNTKEVKNETDDLTEDEIGPSHSEVFDAVSFDV
jgi:hypothetical protein